MPDETLMGFATADDAMPRVGRRALRDALADTMARVHEGGAVEVTYANAREAVVVDSGLYDAMLAEVKASARMHEGMRLAMTAAAAGVQMPGSLMESLGLEIDEEALKRFRSAYPVHITHDEDGAPLPFASALAEPVKQVLVAEDEDDLVFVDE